MNDAAVREGCFLSLVTEEGMNRLRTAITLTNLNDHRGG
nr:MAG TPA: hypothetical protein [Caudoviricetes sp.]